MGSSSNRAGKEAERAEAARQAAIRASQGRINAVFDGPGRAAEIQDAVGASRALGTQDLDRQNKETELQLKFALARNGTAFGSTQNDQQANMAEAYKRGLLEVDRNARGVGASIESADQQARSNLISLATQGLDVTTGAAQAAAAMRTNLEAGKSGSMANSVNLASGQLADFFKRSRDENERRRADRISGFGYYSQPTRG